MTRGRTVAPALAAIGLAGLAGILSAGCGDDGDDQLDIASFDGAYTVTMVVGAASSDPRADASALPAIGTSFTEQWVLECDPSSCSLRRPDGGAILGDLDGLVLAPPPENDGNAIEALTGSRDGVRPEPAVVEPDPCNGTAAEAWTVRVDLSLHDDVLNGSVIRTPEVLAASVPEADCFGVDLTVGLSGVRS